MNTNRRTFLQRAGLTGMGLAGAGMIAGGAGAGLRKATPTNQVILEYATATLEDGSELATPFWRIDSGREGPSLLLLAAQHGNEVQGTEVARQFKRVCAAELVAGRVWLVPMANLPAIRSRRHSFGLEPEQNNRLSDGMHNMQRHWPGDPDGNNTARLAYALDQAVVRHCTHAVDMHCWEHVKAPETLADDTYAPARELAEATVTRFVSYRTLNVPERGPAMLRALLTRRGHAAITIELSGQFQMRHEQVRLGLRSMINIARRLGMIEGEPETIQGSRVVRTAETTHVVRAPCTGMFMPALRADGRATLAPEDPVEKGQHLGHVLRESDLATVPVTAPVSGRLWQFGVCHDNLCDASLPAQHPFVENSSQIARIVTEQGA